MVKNPAAERRYRITVKFLGILAFLFSCFLFHEATIYVGLTESTGNHSYIFKKASKPNAWEKFWGERALELWKNPWANQKDLAVAIVKGDSLKSLSETQVLTKLGEPSSLPNFYRKEYELPLTGGESVCNLCLECDRNTKTVTHSYIETGY